MKVTSKSVLEINLSRLPFYLRDDVCSAVVFEVTTWWDKAKLGLGSEKDLTIYPDPFITLTDTGLLAWADQSVQLEALTEGSFVCDFEGLNEHYNGLLCSALLREDMYKAVSAEFDEETGFLTVTYQDGSINVHHVPENDNDDVKRPETEEEFVYRISKKHIVDFSKIPEYLRFSVALRLECMPMFTGIQFEMRDGTPLLIFRGGASMDLTSTAKMMKSMEEAC